MTDCTPSVGALSLDAATSMAGTIASAVSTTSGFTRWPVWMKPSAFMWSSSAEHRVPEPLDIGEDDRLAVMAELRPGHDLDDLLDRADAARQRHKGVGFLEHRVLALMHVLGDDEFVEALQRGLGGFLGHQEAGNDAGDLAAGAQRAIGHRTHDALAAAAIDQPQAGLGEGAAEHMAGLDVEFAAAGRRAAIDADGSNRVHATDW